MARHRFLSRFLILLTLTLAGCALPGLGVRSFSPVISVSDTAAPPQPSLSPEKTPAVFAIPALQPAPAGILPQVNVLQSGGGGGTNDQNCEGQPGAPHWCRPLNGASLPLTAEIREFACGLGSSVVQAALRLPDGSSQPLQVLGEPPYCQEISFRSTPQNLPGRYQVQVVQGSTTLLDTFQYVLPDHPAGTQLGACAWLAGLAPRQNVRLMVFGLGVPGPETDPLLAAWRYLAEIRLASDADGVVWACPDQPSQTTFPKLVYLADLPSGLLALDEEDLLHSFQGFCADGPAARLAIGTRFRVVQNGLPVFPEPSLDGGLVGTQEAESKGTILSGPVCPPEGPWTWKAAFENGRVGWIAESDAANYFVEPVH